MQVCGNRAKARAYRHRQRRLPEPLNASEATNPAWRVGWVPICRVSVATTASFRTARSAPASRPSSCVRSCRRALAGRACRNARRRPRAQDPVPGAAHDAAEAAGAVSAFEACPRRRRWLSLGPCTGVEVERGRPAASRGAGVREASPRVSRRSAGSLGGDRRPGWELRNGPGWVPGRVSRPARGRRSLRVDPSGADSWASGERRPSKGSPSARAPPISPAAAPYDRGVPGVGGSGPDRSPPPTQARNAWTPERRFDRVFERMALPGLHRALDSTCS